MAECAVMTKRLLIVTVCAALNAGCFEFLNTSLSRPDASVNFLGGEWVSATADAGSLIGACTNFQWSANEQTSTSADGTFTATCFNVLQLNGSARGTMTGSTITWTAGAMATGGGVTDCAVALSGTATLEATEIRIPYTGSTCMGPASGTEILRRK
jgi:Na+-transporting NADH:ubiquinone oxidoreductase subunit NqrB